MAEINIFGAAPLDGAAGYGTDVDHVPIIVATAFEVKGGVPGWQATGVRFYPGSGGIGADPIYAYLYRGLGSMATPGPVTLVAAKQFPALPSPGQWNELRFDAPVDLDEFPGGAFYVAAVYLPHGGYAFKANVFDAEVPAPNADLVALSGIEGPGNGLFDALAGVLPSPGAPPSPVTFAISGTHTHYGVDVLVNEPVGGGGGGASPAETSAPAVTGSGASGALLSCSTGVWTGDAPIAFAYQWQHDLGAGFVPIVGAVAATYVPTVGEETHQVRCVVTATNAIGSASAASNAITITAPAPNTPTTPSGMAVQDGGVWRNLSLGVTSEAGLRPEDYVPVGGSIDDPLDCATALRDCLAAAVSGAIDNGSFYSRIVLDPSRVYDIGDAPLVQGGTTHGNAQIPLPIVPTTSRKPSVVLHGAIPATAMPHWEQTENQQVGGIIKTGLVGAAYDAVHGMPSVVGGPTPEHGYGTAGAVFNNLMLRVEGVVIVAPPNPPSGWDFHGMAAVDLVDIASQVDQLPSNPSEPDNFMFGLRMPANGNNDFCEIGSYSCEGFYRGIIVGEHTNAKRIAVVLCKTGIGVGGPNGHGIHIAYASVESCVDVIEYVDLGTVAWGAIGASIVIDLLDTEDGTSGHFLPNSLVKDPTNQLYGDIKFTADGGAATTTVIGGTHLTLRDLYA